MKAIIFGASGQDGHFLYIKLKESNVDVLRVSRTSGDLLGDVSNLEFVESLIKRHKPDYVFHFAANSSTSHDILFENHLAISTGALNILESVKRHSCQTKIFLSGSAMQFVNNGLPIDESTPFEASSPYSISRIHSAYAGRYYREKLGLKVYIGYFFNHDSELRSERHINQKIAQFVMRISSGGSEVLEVGDIDVRKEFNYAGDVVEAVWLLVNQNEVFEAIIGSGRDYSIKQWIECCFMGLNKNWEDYIVVKKNFIPEYKILVSNPAKIMNLGWRPKVSFEELAEIMMRAKFINTRVSRR